MIATGTSSEVEVVVGDSAEDSGLGEAFMITSSNEMTITTVRTETSSKTRRVRHLNIARSFVWPTLTNHPFVGNSSDTKWKHDKFSELESELDRTAEPSSTTN